MAEVGLHDEAEKLSGVSRQIRYVEQDIDLLLRRINVAYSALHKITNTGNTFEIENLSPGSIRRYG